MLLAIDIGNTNISAGLFQGRRLIKNGDVRTIRPNLHRSFFKKFISNRKIDKIIICSVVPKILPALNKILFQVTGVKPLICGQDVIVPIKNLYRNPRQVGQDRLVNAFAGVRIHGKPLIVIDFGTAVTFDVVSKRGEYLGGIIIPGVDIAFDSLFERTALLPLVKFKLPRDLIGKDTANSIRSGVVFGYASLCDGLVAKLKKRIGSNANVIATGGYSDFIARNSASIKKVEKHLTLKGLSLLS